MGTKKKSAAEIIRSRTREELDEVFDMMACGGLLDPNKKPEGIENYNYGALGRYLRENDKEFSDLTPEEIEMFRIKP